MRVAKTRTLNEPRMRVWIRAMIPRKERAKMDRMGRRMPTNLCKTATDLDNAGEKDEKKEGEQLENHAP